MSYEINPYKACSESGATDINDINDCCYNTIARFSDASSLNSIINTEAADQCKKCVMTMNEKKGILAKNPNKIRPSPPPIWQQTPGFFHSFMKQGNTPNVAYQLCCQNCDDTAYPGQCKDACKIDRLAVVQQTKENYEKENTQQEFSTKNVLLVSSGLILIILFLVGVSLMRK